ncbi:hypothetical protein NESM_000666900 [Novymonas esmeraldas]|uniref:Uncharacterized protein n=1 Tax=Novymonas esmeraldas TaxID=1808958 RepID=A0AAW0EUL3_9TRYP
MRVLRRCSTLYPERAGFTAAVAPLRGTAHEAQAPVTRSSVLSRWTGGGPTRSAAATAADAAPQSLVGRGMRFASGLLRDVSSSTRSASTTAAPDSTVGDVPWDLCERMDYFVQYNVPSSWHVSEMLRDNSIAIQCSPPPPASSESSGLPVHGISLNCFAYKQRVKQADSARLLRVFLARFNASVGNSLEVLCEGDPPPPPASEATLPTAEHRGAGDGGGAAAVYSSMRDGGGAEMCRALATQLRCAVAEITFTPGPGLPLAHGLCRAFYNTNGRFHYVVVVAVPEGEYVASLDLVLHALTSVVESRVEAAARRT